MVDCIVFGKEEPINIINIYKPENMIDIGFLIGSRVQALYLGLEAMTDKSKSGKTVV